MKTTTTVILALLAVLTLYSCTADDEITSVEQEMKMNEDSDVVTDYNMTATMKDTMSNNGSSVINDSIPNGQEIDPPPFRPVK